MGNRDVNKMRGAIGAQQRRQAIVITIVTVIL
jgi:hypothetical protein